MVRIALGYADPWFASLWGTRTHGPHRSWVRGPMIRIALWYADLWSASLCGTRTHGPHRFGVRGPLVRIALGYADPWSASLWGTQTNGLHRFGVRRPMVCIALGYADPWPTFGGLQKADRCGPQVSVPKALPCARLRSLIDADHRSAYPKRVHIRQIA